MCMGGEELFLSPIFFNCFGCGIFIHFNNFLEFKKARKEKFLHKEECKLFNGKLWPIFLFLCSCFELLVK